jgi:hypothetical protein
MAKCSRCGTSLGLLSFAEVCEECQTHLQAEQQLRAAEETENARLAREQYEAQRAEVALVKVQDMRLRIDNGERVILYETIYLPVDSQIVDEIPNKNFSIAALRRNGFYGWDIVAIIPRTFGIALTNTSFGSSSGETWGAGVGGNVVGVHVVIKKEVSAQSNVSDDFLQEYVIRNLDDFLEESD